MYSGLMNIALLFIASTGSSDPTAHENASALDTVETPTKQSSPTGVADAEPIPFEILSATTAWILHPDAIDLEVPTDVLTDYQQLADVDVEALVELELEFDLDGFEADLLPAVEGLRDDVDQLIEAFSMQITQGGFQTATDGADAFGAHWKGNPNGWWQRNWYYRYERREGKDVNGDGYIGRPPKNKKDKSDICPPPCGFEPLVLDFADYVNDVGIGTALEDIAQMRAEVQGLREAIMVEG